MLTLSFLFKVSADYSRSWAVGWFVLGAVGICFVRALVIVWVRRMKRRGIAKRITGQPPLHLQHEAASRKDRDPVAIHGRAFGKIGMNEAGQGEGGWHVAYCHLPPEGGRLRARHRCFWPAP